MLMYLAEYLAQFYSGFNAFQYITLRGVMGVLTALLVSFIVGPFLISSLARLRVGQNIRGEGPESHLVKSGTPTMGGLLILVAVALATVLWADLFNRYVLVALSALLLFGAIGAIDDVLKQRRGGSRGLTARRKFLLQSAVGAAIAFVLYRTAESPAETQLLVPFVKDFVIDMGPWFMVLAYFTVVGSSNAVNLTDGLDGLAIMPTVLIAAALSIFAYASGHAVFSGYLDIPHLPMAGELVVFCGAIVGAGLGFLWFNTYPAQVFMGDIGSLALGASIGLVAVLVRQELVFAVMGGIFVVETLSVMVQVVSYKLTGRRVFRMAPIHHHFELHGWAEPKIIVRFWIITVVLVLIGLATLKIR